MVVRTLLGRTLGILRSKSHDSGQLREKNIPVKLHKSLAHIHLKVPITWTQDDPLKLEKFFFLQTQMQGFMMISKIFFRVEGVGESGQSLHL